MYSDYTMIFMVMTPVCFQIANKLHVFNARNTFMLFLIYSSIKARGAYPKACKLNSCKSVVQVQNSATVCHTPYRALHAAVHHTRFSLLDCTKLWPAHFIGESLGCIATVRMN